MVEGHGVTSGGASAPERTFSLRGGRLCLDFVNTVDNWYDPGRPGAYRVSDDYLTSYADLVSWARQGGAIPAAAAPGLLAAAARRPAVAAAMLERAKGLREAIHGLVAAAIHDQPAADADLEVLNEEIEQLLAVSRLVPLPEGGYVLARPGERDDGEDADALDRPLWAVVRSTIALLTAEEELARVSECPGPSCGWLFWDATGGRRRWCSMAGCGTRAKVRRFRARQSHAASA